MSIFIKETSQTRFIASPETPEARLYQLGPQALSNAELLALLVIEDRRSNRIEVAQKLLEDVGGLLGLQKTTLVDIDGMSNIKSGIIIKAALELGRRVALETAFIRTSISSPEDCAALVQYEMQGLEHEELWVLLLDTKNHVIAIERVYKGSVSSSQVRIGEVFRDAIRRQASAIIVYHNHPSGDPTPSPDDVAITRAIAQAGKLLDIELLDHIVIGVGRFVSLKSRGLGFS